MLFIIKGLSYKEIIDIDIIMDIAKDHGEDETKGKSICQGRKSPMGGTIIGSFAVKPRYLTIWVSHGNLCVNEYKKIAL